MTNHSKNFRNGIIWGIILTILGSFIQHSLQSHFQTKKENKQLAKSTCRFLDSRLSRSKSVLGASESTVFLDRWNSYIYEVIYPWNTNLYLVDNAIDEQYGKDMQKEFEQICEKFKSLHITLNEIRKKQDSKSIESKKKLNNLKNDAKIMIADISPRLKSLKTKLIQ